MSDAVITAEGLSKRYLVAHNPENQGHRRYLALRDVIGREIRNFARKGRDMLHGRQVLQGDEIEEFWALKDVSFEVKRGEVVGIIGRNGAGKSTLLKILSRITEPTEGRVILHGRVASLLEVGTGFHPELTGRENIYLNGAILGMSRVEIRKKFDEIVTFAEVEKFLDTPVKRYSSGMYVRLAFAVAAHLEPEILIVDEVLAVGDAEFQKKCLGKMDDVSRRQGRTVLLVSHNHYVIQSLCQTCILLDRGKIANAGRTIDVLAAYMHPSSYDGILDLADVSRSVPVSGELRLTSFRLNDSKSLRNRSNLSAIVQLDVYEPIRDVVFGVGFNTIGGQRLLSCDSDFCVPKGFDFNVPGEYSIEIHITSIPLTPSPYLLDIGSRTMSGRMLDEIKGFAVVEVTPSDETPPHELKSFPTVVYPSEWRLAPHPILAELSSEI